MLAQVKVSSTTERKIVTVDSASTLAQIFDEAGIATSSDMTITVNGVKTYRSSELSATLDSTGVDLSQQVLVMAVVNAKNA